MFAKEATYLYFQNFRHLSMIIWLLWQFRLHPLLSWKAICKHLLTTAKFGSSTGKQTVYNTSSNLLTTEEKHEEFSGFDYKFK